MRHLWAILIVSAATVPVLFGMSRAGVAQAPDHPPRAESSQDGPPLGGCNPVGITASGEIVFPMTCKEFIERYKAADRNSTASQTKPADADASKAPDAVEASKAPATVEASKAPDAVETSKAPATADASKAPDVVEAGKEPITAGANNKAPTMAKSDEKDAKPAEARAAADQATMPATKQAAAVPASIEPDTTAGVSKRTRAGKRLAGSPGCTRFRTYDAASRTYRDFGGQRRSCP